MYAELHAASAFSFLEGASLPEDLVERARELGYEAVALCDRDGVYGAPRFYQAAKIAGLHPIVGCEISMENGRRLTVLVENRRGYQNLCRLLTRVHLSGPKGQGRASWDDVESYAGGLVALIDDIRDGDRILSIFKPQSAYVELQRHFRDQQEAANQAHMDFAGHHRLPLLAANGVRYARQSSRQLFDALTCIRHKTTLDWAGRLLESNAERHLKSPVEMTRLFRDVPEAVQNSDGVEPPLAIHLAGFGLSVPALSVAAGRNGDVVFAADHVARSC